MSIPLWLTLAIVSGLLSVLYNTFLRHVLKSHDPLAFGWWFEFLRAIAFLVISYFDYSLDISLGNILFLVGLGTVECLSIFLYTKMHAYTELSISSVISRLRIVWVGIVSYLFLGERLMAVEYVGMVLILIGLMSVVQIKSLKVNQGVKYALVSSLVVAFLSPGIKHAQGFASVPVVMFFFTMPSVFIIPVLMRSARERLVQSIRVKPAIQVLIVTVNVATMYTLSYALKSGPVSLVTAVYQSMSMVSVLSGIVLLKEREHAAKKIIGSILALGGVLMMAG